MAKPSVVSEVATKHRTDLAWSLQPIFCSLQILGIDLNGRKSKLRFRCFLLYRTAVVAYVSASYYYVFIWSEWKYDPATTRFWCSVLRRGTRFVSAVLFQLALIVITALNWKALWKTTESMEQFLTSQTVFPGRLRKVSLSLVALVIATVRLSTALIKSTLN